MYVKKAHPKTRKNIKIFNLSQMRMNKIFASNSTATKSFSRHLLVQS